MVFLFSQLIEEVNNFLYNFGDSLVACRYYSPLAVFAPILLNSCFTAVFLGVFKQMSLNGLVLF